MAVSIYHLLDDPFVISENVLDICGDYKLYLKRGMQELRRNHSFLQATPLLSAFTV